MINKNVPLLMFLLWLQFLFINNKSNADSTVVITGRFINVTFLEMLPDTIAGAVPVYCVEINFDGTDSAEIFNGFEEYKLAYKKDGDDFVFQNAAQGNVIPFMMTNDSTIILIDTIWTGSPGMSVFQKVNLSDSLTKSRRHVIDYFINSFMIAGEYQLDYPDDRRDPIGYLAADGSVGGFGDIKKYFICYSGDCVGETVPLSNTITFTRVNGEEITYAFRINKEDRSIDMYNIAPPVKDIKGERAILHKAFSLKRR